MAQRTVYVAQSDKDVWIKAEARAKAEGKSLSQLVTEGLELQLFNRLAKIDADLTYDKGWVEALRIMKADGRWPQTI